MMKTAHTTDPAPFSELCTLICTRDWHMNDARDRMRIAHTPRVTIYELPAATVTTGHHESGRWQDSSEKSRLGWLRWTDANARAIEEAEAEAWQQWRARQTQSSTEKDKKAGADKAAKEDGEDTEKKRFADLDAHTRSQIELARDLQAAPGKNRSRVRERLREFRQAGYRLMAGKLYEPFFERFEFVDAQTGEVVRVGLRSRIRIRSFELYNSRIPKNAEVGYDKTTVHNGCEMEPIFMRDMPYLTIGWWTCRGQVAVDLDTNWPSIAALRTALLRKLGRLAAPNFIVYRCNAAGEVERPHLIWLLPPGSEVGIGGKSRHGPIRYYDAVQRALVSHLIDLGADVGHRGGKTKNPLAPYWSVDCYDGHFATLGDIAAALPTLSTNEKEMLRRQAKFQSVDPEDVSGSMRIWRAVSETFNTAYRVGFKTKDPVARKAFRAALRSEMEFLEWATENVVPVAIKAAGGESVAVRRAIKRQLEWRAHHRPSRQSRVYDGDNRGRDTYIHHKGGLVGAVTTEERRNQGKDRKSQAAFETNRGQSYRMMKKVVEAVEVHLKSGGSRDRKAIIAGVLAMQIASRSTVYDYIDQAITRVHDATRYIASLVTGLVTGPSNDPANQATDRAPKPRKPASAPAVPSSEPSGRPIAVLSADPPTVVRPPISRESDPPWRNSIRGVSSGAEDPAARQAIAVLPMTSRAHPPVQ